MCVAMVRVCVYLHVYMSVHVAGMWTDVSIDSMCVRQLVRARV